MKTGLTAAGLFICFIVSSQPQSIICRAKWNLNEEKIFQITHTTRSYTDGNVKTDFSVVYNARVTVTDSSEKGYTIQWSLFFPESFIKSNPEIVKAMHDFIRMKYNYTTDTLGRFLILNNWEEVRDAYGRMMNASLPKNQSDSLKAALEKAKSLFGTEELVSASLIRDVQVFHAPFGGLFTQEGAVRKIKTANPFGGEPFPALFSQKLTAYNPEQGYYTLELSQHTDSAGVKLMLEGLVSKLNITDEKTRKEMQSAMSEIRTDDFSSYRISLPGNWITETERTRTAVSGSKQKSDSYTIKLLKEN